MNPVVEEVVELVEQIRNSKGFTQEQMADEMGGISRTTYNQVKTGKKRAGIKFYRGAMKFIFPAINGQSSSVVISENNNGVRSSVIERKENKERNTKETSVNVELDLDCIGESQISTGYGMFDHLLSQLARHGKFDIKLTAAGDDPHHVIEDVGICLGQAFNKALGDKRGIVRMAEATVPMDDALATAIVDISGRGHTVLNLSFADSDMFGFPPDLIRHFLESFANEARLNLHARVVYGSNDHHKAEALFKALGRALDMATIRDNRISEEVPSTKGVLEG